MRGEASDPAMDGWRSSGERATVRAWEWCVGRHSSDPALRDGEGRRRCCFGFVRLEVLVFYYGLEDGGEVTGGTDP